MLHWFKMVVVYRRALAERDDSADPLPLPVSLAVFLPLVVIFWALNVIAGRWALGI